MGTLTFSDGIAFDTSGPLRIEARSDGLYVVGQGIMLPAKDRKDAEKILAKLKGD